MTSAERAKDRRLQKTYKITLAQQNEIRKEQGNCCAICGRDFAKFTAFQDHLHFCCPRRFKEFCGRCNRSLLCFSCNKYLVGVLERQKMPIIELLDNLRAYVIKWEKVLRAKGCYDKPDKSKVKEKKPKLGKK
jgi:hypothetical protein